MGSPVAPSGRDRPRLTHLTRALAGLVVAILVLLAIAYRDATDSSSPSTPPPAVGFSYSPEALPPGIDAVQGLATLLEWLQPDLVRLPVYWSDVANEPGELDFAKSDQLLQVVAQHDLQDTQHPTRVVLVVGLRNIDYPEVWAPAWLPPSAAQDPGQLVGSAAFDEYFRATVAHYALNPLLAAWQIENEPLDDVTSGDDSATTVAMSTATVEAQVRELKQVDPSHPALVTTYNSSVLALDQEAQSPLAGVYSHLPLPQPVGHPADALEAGDIFGLDAYVVTPDTPLLQASADARLGWKAGSYEYWAEQAAKLKKRFWITEMQGAPWLNAPGFTMADFLYSAQLYRSVGAQAVLFWGVEGWLTRPDWLAAGIQATRVLRAPEGSGTSPA